MVDLPQPGNDSQPTMARLAAYEGLLTTKEAARYLSELMGPFAPAPGTFEIYSKPFYRRDHPDSAEARHLAPAARNVAGTGRSGWTREQLRAYALARATHRLAADATSILAGPDGPQRSEET